jgi:hypothetical protein
LPSVSSFSSSDGASPCSSTVSLQQSSSQRRHLQLLPPAVAAAAAAAAVAPTGAEQSAFSLRWRLQIQPLLLQRAPQQQQLLTHDAGSSTADLPPKKEEGDRSAEEAEKRDRFEKNGKNPRTDFKKEHNRKNKELKPIALCVFLAVAGDGDSHRRWRKTGKKKAFPIH